MSPHRGRKPMPRRLMLGSAQSDWMCRLRDRGRDRHGKLEPVYFRLNTQGNPPAALRALARRGLVELWKLTGVPWGKKKEDWKLYEVRNWKGQVFLTEEGRQLNRERAEYFKAKWDPVIISGKGQD